MSDKVDPYGDFITRYSERLQNAKLISAQPHEIELKGEKAVPIDKTALAILIVGAEIVKVMRTIGMSLFFEVNALRRVTMGELEEVMKDIKKSKIHLPH